MSNYDNENGTGLEQQVSVFGLLRSLGKSAQIDVEKNQCKHKCMSRFGEEKEKKIKYGSSSIAKIDVICVKAAEKLFLDTSARPLTFL